MTILDTIIARKKIEVIKAKRENSIKTLENRAYFKSPKISLKEFILDKTDQELLLNSNENHHQKAL